MKKRKFKLHFSQSPSTILNADKFTSLKGKLPTDVDVIRRLLIWEQTKIKDPYIINLSDQEYEAFSKEFKQKIKTKDPSCKIFIEDLRIPFIIIKNSSNL